MRDNWYTFPTTMGEDQAWITFNDGFAELAETDQRNNVVQVRVTFASDSHTDEELNALSELDTVLDKLFSETDSLYVGQIMVSDFYYFYFYSSLSPEEINDLINQAADATGFELAYFSEDDPDKSHYWNELYPTSDDWQVISDSRVIKFLIDNGDNPDIRRDIRHWAYFDTQEQVNGFKQWLEQQGFKDIAVEDVGMEDNLEEKFLVIYAHIGSMSLGELTQYTVASNRKAEELGGRYDGWETDIQK
jgi:hypothetical protein